MTKRPHRPMWLAVVAIAVGCGGASSGPSDGEHVGRAMEPIAGGSPAAGRWPGVVWLESGCSAVLVHPEVVVFAAHCGTDQPRVWFGDDLGIVLGDGAPTIPDASKFRSVSVDRCDVYPGADPNQGTDVAYCLLHEPAGGIPFVPPAVGCERAFLADGLDATLVGYGYDSVGGRFGAKRVATAAIDTIGNEITIGSNSVGTCRGDSGSPAFVRVPTVDSGTEWRLAGVLSGGMAGQCGTGYYEDLSKFTRWLTDATQRDIAPCFDSTGQWAPTKSCVSPAVDSSGLAQPSSTYSSTCGPGFAQTAALAVLSPPRLQIVTFEVNGSAKGPILHVIADAGPEARARGVRVELEQQTASGRRLSIWADEVVPYEFTVPLESFAMSARVTAVDADGESVAVGRVLWTIGGGCSMAGAFSRAGSGSTGGLSALVLAMFLTCARRPGTRARTAVVATFRVRTSRGAPVGVVQTAEHGDGLDAAFGFGRPRNGLLLGESLVRTRLVVEAHVLDNEAPQVRLAHDQYVVE